MLALRWIGDFLDGYRVSLFDPGLHIQEISIMESLVHASTNHKEWRESCKHNVFLFSSFFSLQLCVKQVLSLTRLRYMVVGRNNSVALLITCGDCAAFVFSFWKGDDGKRLGPGIQNHAAIAIVFHGLGFDHKMGKVNLICKCWGKIFNSCSQPYHLMKSIQ